MDYLRGIVCGAGVLVKRARAGDVVVLSGGAALGVVVGLGLYHWAYDGECTRHQTEDQKAFAKPFSVVAGGAEVSVIPVTGKTIDAAAASIAKAYSVDPMILACTQENARPAARLEAEAWLARTFLRAVLPPKSGNIVIATAGYEAVAIWRTRGSVDVDVGSLLWLGAWQYMFRLSGWDRRGRLPGFSRVLTANRHRLMAAYGDAYFHLLSATVRPDAADAAAVLTAVVQPLCQLADARGVPCYVEVTQPALVAAYAALGFEAPEPPKELFGVPVSPMRRLPSAGRKA